MLDSTSLVFFGILAFAVVACIRAPAVAVGLYLCTYGLEQWAQSRNGWFFANGWLTNMATAGILLWALAVRQTRGLGTLGDGLPSTFWLTIGLLGYAAVSTFWSIVGITSLENLRSSAPYLAASVVLMPLVLRDFRDLRAALLMTLMLGTVVLLLLLTTTSWTGRQIELQTGSALGVGSEGNPLAIASLGGWIALIALLTNFKGLGKTFTWVRYGLVLAGTVVCLRADSRGQAIALLVAGLAMLPASRKIHDFRRLIVLIFTGIITLAVLFAAFSFLGVGDRGRWETETMLETYSGSRFGMAMILINAWLDAGPISWLLGLGSSASFSPDLIGGYPHLVPLEVLGELGLFGFALFGSIIVITGVTLIRMVRSAPDSETRGMVAAVGALYLFEFMLCFKQGSLVGSPMLLGFGVLIGRLWVDYRARGIQSTTATSPYPDDVQFVPATATASEESMPQPLPRSKRPRPSLPRPRVAPTPPHF